jgi:hypothetical protein
LGVSLVRGRGGIGGGECLIEKAGYDVAVSKEHLAMILDLTRAEMTDVYARLIAIFGLLFQLALPAFISVAEK